MSRSSKLWLSGAVFSLVFEFSVTAMADVNIDNTSFGVFSSHERMVENFIEPEGITTSEYYEWVNGHMASLGANWTRITGDFFWWETEPVLNGGYDWTRSDRILDVAYDPDYNLNTLVVLTSIGAPDGRNPIDHKAAWQQFVTRLAERYDGDGIDDAHQGQIQIDYYQYINELHNWFGNGFSIKEYAQSAKETLAALRQANPDAQLVLIAHAGNTGVVDPRFTAIIQECVLIGVDIAAVDFHYWGGADEWFLPEVLEARNLLDSMGLFDVEIWSTENGTWVGCPIDEDGNSLPYQTERQQARSMVKRYAWARANGVERLFWNNLLDYYNFAGNDSNAFNAMGLISDGLLICDPGQRGRERLAYWTYQLLAGDTNNCSAAPAAEQHVPWDAEGLYTYRYTDNETGDTLYIIWSESGNREIRLERHVRQVEVTELITDSQGRSASYTRIGSRSNPVTLTIGADPILIRIKRASEVTLASG